MWDPLRKFLLLLLLFTVMPGKGTANNSMFIMQQVQKKRQANKKTLYYAYVDSEKAFNRVPREGGGEMGFGVAGCG